MFGSVLCFELSASIVCFLDSFRGILTEPFFEISIVLLLVRVRDMIVVLSDKLANYCSAWQSKQTSFSSGVKFLCLLAACRVISATVLPEEPLCSCCASANNTDQAVAGATLGVLSRACAFKSFSLATRSRFSLVLDGGFGVLTTFFAFGLGLGLGLAFTFGLALVTAFGFLPTLLFPAAVFGPGFDVADTFVVRLAGVLPVCCFGRPAGLAAAVVAYVRVA